MRSLGIVLLLLVACKDPSLVSVTECGLPCYGGPSTVAGVGECHRGRWSCDGDGLVCIDWQAPEAETCDGLDNDCDGVVDDIAKPCTTACGFGTTSCITGAWEVCSAPQPKSETCNGKDDDCDGLIDEPEDLPLEFCYTGPPNTLPHGVCRPGIMRCSGKNQWVCTGQQLPSSEVCNGLDDNCDGSIDENLRGNGLDLVFVIDNSCSMSLTIQDVKAATKTWVTKYQNRPDLRFALVGAPDPNPIRGSTPTLQQNLGSAQNLNAIMDTQQGSGDYNEDTLGALEQIAAAANPLGLAWTAGARRVVVVYSDEEPQHYALVTKTPDNIGQICAQAGVIVHVFTVSYFFPQWDPVPTQSGGQLRNIQAGAPVIEADLDALIALATCQ